jgi:hypothetical protein
LRVEDEESGGREEGTEEAKSREVVVQSGPVEGSRESFVLRVEGGGREEGEEEGDDGWGREGRLALVILFEHVRVHGALRWS